MPTTATGEIRKPAGSSSLTPGLEMHLMGYRSSTREIETMMHYWRYIGHPLGVQPRWYPETVREGLHPLLQAPAVRLVDTLRRRSAIAARTQDRYARRRRETWWRNEMGEKQSHFQPAEEFRR